MTKINTTRFGEIEVEEKLIIRFPDGLIGFPDLKRFTLLEHKPGSPFMWLQSLDDPDLAFVVMNPLLVKADYLQDAVPQDCETIAGEGGDKDPIVLAIATIPHGEARKMTVNLQGPLVIDIEAQIGRQIILATPGYSTRHTIMQQ
jgi:flagellar assembly factor FliW